MAMTNLNPVFRAMAVALCLCGSTLSLNAQDANAQDANAKDGTAEDISTPAGDAPTAAPSPSQMGYGSSRDVFPSDISSPIQRAYPRSHMHPTDPTIDSSNVIAQVAHGPVAAQTCNCGHCRTCVNRTGEGMIGGIGMKVGLGTKGKREHECWQCPYNAPFNVYNQGEYAGPARTERIYEYRLRTGDAVQLTFLITALKSEGSYRLVVGDELLIEAEADEELTRGTLDKGLVIQPDGTITLRLIGQVHAAGQTIEQLRAVLESRYEAFYPEPSIDVTPVNTGTAAVSIREAISGVGGFEPQDVTQTITPAGEIRLPRLGAVQAQGLTLDELKQEINLRYDQIVGGLEVEPLLERQAPHFFYVLGEVNRPGRYEMGNVPTTALSALAMAGGHIPGANLRQVVIFRRGDNWELLSTLLDLRGAILGHDSHPCDEIWLRDGDVIIVPAAPIRLFNNFVQQVFTDGLYGAFPFTTSYQFNPGGQR